MSHEYRDEIICPYCGYKFHDSWEYNDDDGKIYCIDCDKEFILRVNISVDYSTFKINCTKHDYNEPTSHTIDQATCDRWNVEKWNNRTDHKPYTLWEMKCKNCDHEEIKSTEPGCKCPWEDE